MDLQEMGGAGHGGHPMPADQVISWRSIGRGTGRESDLVGELVPRVARAKLRLDNESELDAQVVRTDVVENDYFVAFFSLPRKVVQVLALDEKDRVLACQDIDPDRLDTRPSPGPWPPA